MRSRYYGQIYRWPKVNKDIIQDISKVFSSILTPYDFFMLAFNLHFIVLNFVQNIGTTSVV